MFKGEEVAFIKNFKADSESDDNEDVVELLQYYCDTF